ncbi:hypothetical protein A4R44_06521 [Amycolatopsis sp. M39]|nr:hypothetical protein A4R44_06521 [Amycolatopsis sp. M39]
MSAALGSDAGGRSVLQVVGGHIALLVGVAQLADPSCRCLRCSRRECSSRRRSGCRRSCSRFAGCGCRADRCTGGREGRCDCGQRFRDPPWFSPVATGGGRSRTAPMPGVPPDRRVSCRGLFCGGHAELGLPAEFRFGPEAHKAGRALADGRLRNQNVTVAAASSIAAASAPIAANCHRRLARRFPRRRTGPTQLLADCVEFVEQVCRSHPRLGHRPTRFAQAFTESGLRGFSRYARPAASRQLRTANSASTPWSSRRAGPGARRDGLRVHRPRLRRAGGWTSPITCRPWSSSFSARCETCAPATTARSTSAARASRGPCTSARAKGKYGSPARPGLPGARIPLSRSPTAPVWTR